MTHDYVRGIDHVGVTVPDIEAATTFLIEAFGARVVYESFTTDQPPQGSPEIDRRLDRHPVVRMEAIVDCLTRSITWKGIGYADAMVGPSAIYSPFRTQSWPDTYPSSLDPKRAEALCDLPIGVRTLP